MKTKRLLLFWSFAIASVGMSQVSIQGSDVNPQVSDSFTVIASSWVSPGDSGENVTWDFSDLLASSLTMDVRFIPANSSFPGANVVMETFVGSQGYETHLVVNDDGQYMHAYGFPGNLIDFQEDPLTLLKFPLNMSLDHTDSFSGTAAAVGLRRAGTSRVVGDAYGTLTTPEGTFTDVVRVMYETDFTDSSAMGVSSTSFRSYIWYKAGIHYALLTISESTSGSEPTQYSAQYLTNIQSLGIENNVTVPTVSLFPNPANSVITIDMEGFKKVELMSVAGKKIRTSYTAKLDVSALPGGVYFAIIEDENGRIHSEKVIIK